MSTDGQAGARRAARWAPPARRRVLGWVAVIGVLAAWWLTLAPTVVGGPATYVVVVGTSMEPRWHTGDIVVTHTRGAYGVGDIVAMDTGAGKAIHRIVGGDAGAYVTKGDNRDDADGWRVDASEVIGEAWFTAPFTVLQLLQWGPPLAGLLAFALVAWPSQPSSPREPREPGQPREPRAARRRRRAGVPSPDDAPVVVGA